MLYFASWKVYLIVGICVLGIVFASPNLLPSEQAEALPDWLPHKQISLGLDLQGGSHLLLEVEVDAVVRERLTALVDEARVALRGARVGYRGSVSAATRFPYARPNPVTSSAPASCSPTSIDRLTSR